MDKGEEECPGPTRGELKLMEVQRFMLYRTRDAQDSSPLSCPGQSLLLYICCVAVCFMTCGNILNIK